VELSACVSRAPSVSPFTGSGRSGPFCQTKLSGPDIDRLTRRQREPGMAKLYRDLSEAAKGRKDNHGRRRYEASSRARRHTISHQSRTAQGCLALRFWHSRASTARGAGMIVEPFKRFFLRHELRFRTPRGAGVPLPFRSNDRRLDVENVLQTAIRRNAANLVLRNRDVVRLTEMRVRPGDNVAILLFRRSDPDASNPIFENERTRALRPSDKRPDEAIAISAHLFIRLEGIPDAAHPTYRAILEEVPGLTRTYIQALLHEILTNATYRYTDKRGQEKETYTIPELHGLKSERVSGALRGQSVVPTITLVRPANIRGLDTEGLITAREEKMKLIVRAEPRHTLRIIRKIQAWMARHDWPKMVLEMDMPEDRRRLVALAREADAADILFVRSEPIDVRHKLEVCTDTINEELLAKAQELFAADAG
jgi:hypothetical protein